MNGTGGRETGEGPAHRFNHNRWSDPAPGVQALAPGVAVLACACGTVLDAGDMVKAPSIIPRVGPTSGSRIPRIMCVACAAKLEREAES